MLYVQVKLSVVDRIHPPQKNKFAMGVENKATDDLKLNDCPDMNAVCTTLFHVLIGNNTKVIIDIIFQIS